MTSKTHVYFGLLFLIFFCIPSLYPQERKTLAYSAANARSVEVGGKKFWIKTAGVGDPVVVLDYGLGGRMEDWDAVFPAIAKFTRVVAYDRAGYGKSDSGIEPRSQTQI